MTAALAYVLVASALSGVSLLLTGLMTGYLAAGSVQVRLLIRLAAARPAARAALTGAAGLWELAGAGSVVIVMAAIIYRGAGAPRPAPRLARAGKLSSRGLSADLLATTGQPPCKKERRCRKRTLVLIKPDGVRRGLIGAVISRIECKGLSVVALELRTLDRETASTHYAEHAGKPFFDPVVDFITSGPVALVVEGPRAVEAFRALAGATDPVQASPGTIRGDHALEIGKTSCTAPTRWNPPSAKSKDLFPGTRLNDLC